jgi:hypothetical protein
MIFKKIRSQVGKLFSEHQQMLIVMWLSEMFWRMRKYFLSVIIDYPEEFLENWNIIKKKSSQDKERNFTVYQMIKIHNQIFHKDQTNIIEFGTDRGGTLTTICKFSKENSKIFAVDSFGFHAEEIKKNVSKYDEHYHGKYKPFTKETRFRDFDYKKMTDDLNSILKKKNSHLDTIVGFFPNLSVESMNKISNLKFSFVHIDFDLYQPTIDCFNFIKERLVNNAIVVVDDYNLINQEGVKEAIKSLNVDLRKSFQTSGGQLIIFN